LGRIGEFQVISELSYGWPVNNYQRFFLLLRPEVIVICCKGSEASGRVLCTSQVTMHFLLSFVGLFLGGKATGTCRSPPTTSSARVKERVEIYLYSPSGTSWPVLGRNLPLLSPTFTAFDYI